MTEVQLDVANRVQSVERRGASGTVLMRAGYSYTDNDQVETITYGNGQVVVYSYEGAGRVERISHMNLGGDVHLRLEYTYDGRGLPTSIAEKSGPAGNLVLDATTTFTYDRRGRLLTEVREDGAWITYDLAYTYDPGGNRTKKQNFTAGICIAYEYDISPDTTYGTANNRLMKERVFTNTDCAGGADTETFYDYNADGNVTRITTTEPGGDILLLMSTGGPLVQSAEILSLDDEITQSAPGGGGAAAQAGGGGGGFCFSTETEYTSIRFGYAQNGQAVTFVHDEHWCVTTGCGTGSHDCVSSDCTRRYEITFAKEFRYDGARARYLVRNLDVNDFKSGITTATSEVWSDYDGDTLYGDFDPGSGSTMASYEPGIWQSIGGSADYLHSDMIGTLRTTSDENGVSGSPEMQRVFTAFGEKIAGPQDRNGYAGAWGYQTHTEFDFQHVGARYYNPSSGRFLQRDPIGIMGGLNVYAYVHSSPTTAIDPEGLSSLFRGDALIVLIEDGLAGGGTVTLRIGGKVVEVVGSRSVRGGVEFILKNGNPLKILGNSRIKGRLTQTCTQIIVEEGTDFVFPTLLVILVIYLVAWRRARRYVGH